MPKYYLPPPKINYWYVLGQFLRDSVIAGVYTVILILVLSLFGVKLGFWFVLGLFAVMLVLQIAMVIRKNSRKKMKLR